jgi:Kef-type K+ transport system membrane component KefB/mannitol/fructose-specific phosphotransferase system IIA component (Ntr-type)
MKTRFSVLWLFGLGATTVLASEAGGTEAGMTHRMMLLVIQLGLILFATKMGNMLFERFKLPGCLGELTAGIVIGPHLLGGIGLPGFPHGLFPLAEGFPVSVELYGFCAVASIVLLFMVGLETDLGMFLRYSVAGSAVGLGGVIASFVLGDFAGVLLGEYAFGRPLGFFDPASLFLGVISTATSVGITARVLAEKRKLDTPEGVTILSGAVVDDVLGIILLTVVLGVVSASKAAGHVDWAHIGIIAVKAVGIWLVATILGLLSARRIGTLLKLFHERSSIAVMALGLALILAGFFEEAGLAMIIGAYVMGLSLSRTDIANVVREKLTPIYVLLVPLFFGVMGMLVDFGALGERRILVFGAVYSVLAVAAKIIGGGLPALGFGFNGRGALRVGMGMVPRGEVALIVAGVGLAAGAVEADVFGIAILMTAVSTFVAPPLLGLLFASDKSGLRRPAPAEAESAVTFPFPTREIAEWVLERLRHTFEAEGFFFHDLEHEHGLYQVRKDTSVINLAVADTSLSIHCGADELPLIRTAVYEVLCELQGTIRRLQEPVDLARMGRDVQGDGIPAAKGLRIANFLNPRAVKLRLKGTTKDQVLNELLNLLAATGEVGDVGEAHRALLEREESMSTGLVEGVAIPHARTTAVSHLVCAIGLKPEGVDFDSLDGQPSRLFVLTLSPENAPAPHVQFMAGLGQALVPGICGHLLQCQTAEEVVQLLGSVAPPAPTARPGGSQELLAGFLKADLMIPRLKGTTSEAVIDELLALVQKQGLVSDFSGVRKGLLEREKVMPTGLEHGIAVPHIRTDAVTELVCAVGLKPEGLEFGCMDGQPAKIVVLTLSPTNHPVPHVQFMSSLVRLLSAVDLDQLTQAPGREAIRGILLDAAASSQAS